MVSHLTSVSNAIHNCTQTFAQADEFSGVVVIHGDRGEILSAAYGLADPVARRANTVDTPFNVASVGKIFTSAAIGQLIDRNRVNLHDPVGKHLPELPASLARITVSQLLKHSSGVGDIFKPEHQPRIASARTARELLPVIAAQQPLFAPGSQHRYSNTGALILGAVIEAVSGRPYATYVEENIFRPVGMGSSAIRAVPDNAAVMLTRSEVLTGEMRITAGQKLARRPTSFAGGGPFGGGYSSAPDLLRFASAMRSSRLVSETTKAALLSDPAAVPGAGPGRYAHGFQVSEEGGTKVVGHSGLAGGANAEFHWAPEDGWTLVVLSNYDPMSSTIIANAARLALTGMEKPEAACEAAKRGRGMPGPLGPPAGGRHGHSPGPGLGGGPIEQGRSPFKSIPSERGR